MKPYDRGQDRWVRAPRWSAAVGMVLWLALWGVPGYAPDAVINLLLLAPLVTVPLTLALTAAPRDDGAHALAYRAAVALQPIGAIAGVLSFGQGPGALAAWLSAVWLAVLGCVVAFGLERTWRLGVRPWRWSEVSIGAGLVMVSVGGIWWVFSRAGMQPSDLELTQAFFHAVGMEPVFFSAAIVLLTAVHFHYAGFAAPVLVGLAGRLMPPQGWARRLYQAGTCALLAGIPMTAVGITASPWVEALAAWTLAAGLTTVGVLTLALGLKRLRPLGAQVLVGLASLAVIVSMGFAALYAYGEIVEHQRLSLGTMALSHGVLNALGFALVGLSGWTLADLRGQAPSPQA